MENNQNKNKKQSITQHIDPKLAPKENHNFVQIKDHSLRAIQMLIKKSPISAAILFFFIEKMGRLNNSVVCSYKTLMEVTGYSRPTVARAIKLLKDERWIDTVKVGSSTAYCVNAQVAWRAANNQKHYAIFSSTVIATSSEQDEGYDTNRKLRNIPNEFNAIKDFIEKFPSEEEIQEPKIEIPEPEILTDENSDEFVPVPEDPELDMDFILLR